MKNNLKKKLKYFYKNMFEMNFKIFYNLNLSKSFKIYKTNTLLPKTLFEKNFFSHYSRDSNENLEEARFFYFLALLSTTRSGYS